MSEGDPTPLTPTHRRRGDVRGTPVEIDGQTWLLAAYVPRLRRVWDVLYDDNALSGVYSPKDLRVAAYYLLLENYDLDTDEAAELARTAQAGALVPAVEAALFGAEPAYRSYSDWVISACWSNGIDPDSVPPERLRDVVTQLVATGRAVPANQFISSIEAAQLRAELAQIAGPAR